MKSVALVIGHGPRVDRGAVSVSGISELDYNTSLVNLINIHLHRSANIGSYIVNRKIERVQPWKETNETGADCAIEFHLNSNGPTATGIEMVHFPTSEKGKRLAGLLQAEVVAALGLRNRGIKPPWNNRGMSFLQKTKMPAVIAESFFVSNEDDLRVGLVRMGVLAEAYARGIAKFLA